MADLYKILHRIIDRLPHHSETDGQELHAAVDQLADDDETAAPTDGGQDQDADTVKGTGDPADA